MNDSFLYYGGTILTMDEKNPFAEAVLTGDGRILAAGSLAELEPLAKGAGRLPLEGRRSWTGTVIWPVWERLR